MDVLANAAANAANLRAKRAQSRQLIPACTRAAPNLFPSPNLSDGVVLGGTSRFTHTALITGHGVVIAYSNRYNNAGTEASGPNDINVRASVESPNTATPIPVFFGGKRDVVIPPGATVYSDPVGIPLVKGSLIATRTHVTVAAVGLIFPKGGYSTNNALAEGVDYSAQPVDKTLSGTVTATIDRPFGPSAILALPTTAGASVLGIIGDSIATGSGDTGVWGDGGWPLRALNNNYPYLVLSQPSELVDGWMGSNGSTRWRRTALMERAGLTHLLCELGVNSTPNPSLQQNLAKVWIFLASYGLPLYQTTITPQTTSTDAYATVGNQTVASSANETRRLACNAWIRGGAPLDPTAKTPVAVGTGGALLAGQAGHPLTGYLEVADLVESARDSGLWKAAYTADGTHPNATGHAAIAPVLNPTAIGMVAAA